MWQVTTTWRASISATMAEHGDAWSNVESVAANGSLDAEFDSGWGLPEGCGFTVWTKERVYFPVQYDGSEWCGSAPRNPNGEVLEHQGGG